jgi:hypothetical protein
VAWRVHLIVAVKDTIVARCVVTAAAASVIALGSACAHTVNAIQPGVSPAHPSEQMRLEAISGAEVWAAVDVPSMDLRAGPQGRGAIPAGSEVECTYVDREMNGATPKFECALAPGDVVKVKYGEHNAEVYGEVASSRLLWALGFGADRWYPAHVVCHGCPADPHHDHESRSEGPDVRFDVAAIERKFPGKTFEAHPDEGWKWDELGLVSANGAPQEQRDALTLLAVLIQHSDNKADQQRLNCLEPDKSDARDWSCRHPFMYVHDVGLTFGKASLLNRSAVSGVNFENWSRQPIWQDATTCVGNISKAWRGSLHHPVISEAGRRFLAGLLVQLSDAQLTDLFEVAQFPLYSHVNAAQWVEVFKQKRGEIVHRTCPS